MSADRFTSPPDDAGDDAYDEIDPDLYDEVVGDLTDEELDNLTAGEMADICERLGLPPLPLLPPAPENFAAAIEQVEEDQIREYLVAFGAEGEFLEELLEIHRYEWIKPPHTPKGEWLKPFRWFESKGYPIERYAHYLHRQHLREKITEEEALLEAAHPDDCPQIETSISVRLTALARLEDLYPGDP